MREVVRHSPAAVEVEDLIGMLSRLLADVVTRDPHDRHLPIRFALSGEIEHQRAGLFRDPAVPEEVD